MQRRGGGVAPAPAPPQMPDPGKELGIGEPAGQAPGATEAGGGSGLKGGMPGRLAEPSLSSAPTLAGRGRVCLTPDPAADRGPEEGLPSFGSPLTRGSPREKSWNGGQAPDRGFRAPAPPSPSLRVREDLDWRIPPREGGLPAPEPPPRTRGSEDRTGRGRGLFCASASSRFTEVCPGEGLDWGGVLPRDRAHRPRKGGRGHRAPPPRPHLRPAPRPPRPARPPRCAAAAAARVRTQVRPPRPRPRPRPAGAPCLSSGRRGAPDAAAGGGAARPRSPRAAGRGRGAGRGAGEGAARLRPKPGADPAAGLGLGESGARRFQRPPPPTPPQPAGWGRVSAASDARS